MRVAFLALLVLLLPTVLAHEPPTDETIAIDTEDLTNTSAHGESVVFVKVCGTTLAVGRMIDDCLLSGIWQNTNGWGHLQVRSGTFVTEAGQTVAFGRDSQLTL